MRITSLFYLAIGLLFLTSTTPIEKEVKVTCTVLNCEKTDSLYLFEFDGIDFDKMQAVPIVENEASFNLPMSEPRFYYVGLAANNARPLIVGPEENIGMESECNGFRNARIMDSKFNQEYEALKIKMTALANETGALAQEYRIAKTPAEQSEVAAKFANLDKRKLAFLEETQKANPYLGKIVALNMYLSFQNNGQKYKDEIEYFAKEYYAYINWNDKELNYLPWVYESLKNYAITLSSVGLHKDLHISYIENQLKQIPENSRTYRLALGGILAGLDEKNHPNYVHFGKKMVEKYKSIDPQAVAQVEQKIKRLSAFSEGGEAPDFTLNQPDGTSLSLSDLRGKVILVDFWASWCGPCRRENPHVVALYNKYKDKGFDILGVSLDNKKERWEQAIEQDGLTWHHVSDLKGWSSSAAQLYGVRSIPHTVLLDKEGRIIARNLRSHQLETKLEEILGKK